MAKVRSSSVCWPRGVRRPGPGGDRDRPARDEERDGSGSSDGPAGEPGPEPAGSSFEEAEPPMIVALVAGLFLAGRGLRSSARAVAGFVRGPDRSRPIGPIVLTVYVVEAGSDDDDGDDDDGDDDDGPEDPEPDPVLGAEVEVPVELVEAVEEIFS